jgi:hypothetical protein
MTTEEQTPSSESSRLTSEPRATLQPPKEAEGRRRKSAVADSSSAKPVRPKRPRKTETVLMRHRLTPQGHLLSSRPVMIFSDGGKAGEEMRRLNTRSPRMLYTTIPVPRFED